MVLVFNECINQVIVLSNLLVYYVMSQRYLIRYSFLFEDYMIGIHPPFTVNNLLDSIRV